MEGIEYLIKVKIADLWVHDGFRLKADLLKDAIDEKLLGGLTDGDETEVEIVKEPSEAAIERAIKRHEATL